MGSVPDFLNPRLFARPAPGFLPVFSGFRQEFSPRCFLAQDLDNLLVIDLLEPVIKLAHRGEVVRKLQAYDFIRVFLYFSQRILLLLY